MQKQVDKGDAFANLLNTLAANGVKIDNAVETSSTSVNVSDNNTDTAAADTCVSNALDVSKKNSELISNSSEHALSVEEAASVVEKNDSIEADMDKDFADINGCIEADTLYKRYIEDESDELGDTYKVSNQAEQTQQEEEVDNHTKGLEVGISKDSVEDTNSSSTLDTPSNDKQMAAYAPISTAKRKTPLKSNSSATTQSIPLKSSQVDSKTSLLTKGMSYFGRSTMTTPKQSSVRYNNTNSDTQSVMSEISTDVKSTISSAAKAKQEKEDIILKQHLKESGLILLKRLIEFLSECPPTIDEGSLVSEWRRKKESSKSLSTTQQKNNKKKRARGLTLPASAIGWLSSQLLDDIDDTDILDDVPRQQLDCVHMLLRRVTSLRISGEVWPPPHPSTIKGKSKKNLDDGKKSLTTNLLSKLAIDTGSIDDESSCGTGGPSSTVHDVISPPTLSKFQYYHHEKIQYNPNVNMIFFPNVSKLVINGIPPNWISNLDTCKKLDIFQLEKGCILDVNMLFFPGDVIPPIDTSLHEDCIPRNLSLIDEDMEKKVTTDQHDGDDDKDNIKQQPVLSATPFEYKSISKLKLSNCAISETAGLRGIKRRRRSNNVPRIPPLARFPNLTSLNLSNNELFKSNTVFAGLSALPLLSSIDLSFNRLSRYVLLCVWCV